MRVHVGVRGVVNERDGEGARLARGSAGDPEGIIISHSTKSLFIGRMFQLRSPFLNKKINKYIKMSVSCMDLKDAS